METINFETETKLVKIDQSELEKVVKSSGLSIQESDEIKASYVPFIQQLAQAQADAVKINFDTPSQLDENIARELRLKVVKIRTGAEKLKDERKRMYLLRGNLEQASFNLISASCKVTEEVFTNVEKAREIAERKRKEELRRDRSEKLSPYAEEVAFYPLGEMSEDQFTNLYHTLRDAHERKIAEERKAEEERIAREKAEEAERERIGQDNIRLQKEAEERERKMIAEREAARKEQERKDKEYEEKARNAEAERQRLIKDAEEKAKKAEEARKEQAKLIEQAEAKARKEREEKEKVEAELRAKKEAEERAKAEAIKKQKEAEKKARLAPDKQKLLDFGQALNNTPRPEIRTIEAMPILANINGLLVKLNNYIIESANKL